MISLVIPIKNRLPHLKECLPTWLNQTYTDFEIIIVDMSCPQFSGRWVDDNITDTRVRVHYKNVRPKYWNLCEARNEGIREAKGAIVGVFDADTLMQPTFIEESLSRLTERSFMNGNGVGHNHGCCIAHRYLFYEVGGYNELLKGWGFDDESLYRRMRKAGVTELTFKDELVYLIPHDDKMRVEYQNYKNIQASNHNNYWFDTESGKFKGL